MSTARDPLGGFAFRPLSWISLPPPPGIMRLSIDWAADLDWLDAKLAELAARDEAAAITAWENEGGDVG